MYYIVSIEGHATRTKSINEDNHREELSLAIERLNKGYEERTKKKWNKNYNITTHFEDIDFE